MLNDIDQRLNEIKSKRLLQKDDHELLQTEALLLVAKEVQDLNRKLQAVTAASDFVPGGQALRVVQADK